MTDTTSLASWKDSSGTRHWGTALEGEVRFDHGELAVGQNRLAAVLEHAMGKCIRLTVEVIPHPQEQR